MKSFNRARLAVALAVLVSRRDGQHDRLAADRRRDGEERHRVSRQPDPEQREKAGDPLDSRGSHALELHPDQHVSAAGAPHQGDDRAAAQARARAPARAASASVATRSTTTIMNDLEAILRDTEAAARAAKPQPAGARQHPRSRAVLLHGLRHAGTKGTLGLAGRRPPRLAALHHRQRQRRRRRPDVLGHQPGGSARRAEEGPARARQGAGRRPRADDGARRGAAEDGDRSPRSRRTTS